ncbi:GyrI-like domain-containing protein [Bacillus suaedaesalsae]|uniref:GyrI-like domain-containing protein n=1 Tax=Bacillus suaedaesalsae TaxID=2810349 RepID=A0ABS2DHT9_9BACI|nr:GyrI-like domain-containing protein [Bacillus suaedaesalsae]MBM6618040.1 GyrI-like domain-containing protein [Bacillus suaedaesalsae]
MKIVELDSFKVVGLKVVSHWSGLSAMMPNAWQQIHQRVDELTNRTSPYFYDICLQLVGEDFTQLVGCEVSNLEEVPHDMEGYEILPASYIYSHHTLPVEQMYETFQSMYTWANENGYTIDPTDFKIQKTSMSSEEEGHHLFLRII